MPEPAGDEYRVTDPATGTVHARYPAAGDAAAERAAARADAAFRGWRATPAVQRAALLHRVADLHIERREVLAATVTREMGKPIAQARGEVDICAAIYRYYADRAPGFLADEAVETAGGGTAVVRTEGIGPLLGIMPWNYPLYQVARFAAPNLALGNTLLVKPAPQCPESSAALAAVHADAGAPDGVFAVLRATTGQAAGLIADPRVHGVSLTGSERAGAAVAEQAGRHLKKAVLELGGSDPFIVLGSADVDRAVRDAVAGRFGNTGQACNAAKRIIVPDAAYDAFLSAFTGAVAALEAGDPGAPETFIGPMASAAGRDLLAAQVADALDAGAEALVGGMPAPGAPGTAWYPPTVLTGVAPGMRAYAEELFGPVAVVYRVPDADAAVALANATDYGLGASVHGDPEEAAAVADRIDAGMVAINRPSGTAAELPFGGVKRSGIGRELGRWGLEEFANRKLFHSSPR